MMDPMSTPPKQIATGRHRRTLTAALAAASVLALGACGGAADEVVEAAAPATTASAPATTRPATTTTAPTTTAAPPTTLAPTTTAAPTTTSTTTTTTTLVVDAPVSQPIAPPADAYASEPVIEVGSIVIPKIGVDMTMYEGIRLTTLDYGPGHWPGSAMPGQAGNLVVGGHRTSGHRVFRDVDQLEAGDEIVFRDDAGEHTYIVSNVEVVEPTEVWIVEPTETPTATLFACHPPGSTAQRIVVFADLAEPAST
mgnify:CR=1 FL=1